MSEDGEGSGADAGSRGAPAGDAWAPYGPYERRPPRHRREREARKSEEPEPLGGLVESLLKKWGMAEKVERAGAAAEWEELVGPRIASVTREVRVRGRTLIVEVESASWLSELNMMRHRILERVNEGRDRGRVEKIVFVQSDGTKESGDR